MKALTAIARNTFREAVIDGAVGTLSHVHVWGNRSHNKKAYLPAAGDPPGMIEGPWRAPSSPPEIPQPMK